MKIVVRIDVSNGGGYIGID